MNIKIFVEQWKDVSGERANYQKFWLTLIRDVFNIDKPENFIKFEEPVKLAHKNFIDAYLPDSQVIIEQKNSTVNLDEETFSQAKRYNDALEYSRRARWIITCNFREFRIYDMETLEPPIKILLEELPEKYHLLDFLIDPTKNKLRLELELSLQAGEIVAKIYDALLTQYVNPNSAESLSSLNKLCVRLVFCLYAESSGIFGAHKIFRDYLSREYNLRWALIHLFEVLNTPLDERDPYLDDTLKNFPYVNGGLFDDKIEIPNFTTEIRTLLLEEASSGFNWSGISPTIFGAVFESTLNPETRRAGGMHYTSIENIHKVIDPIFMDDLRGELAHLRSKKKLLAFQEKLAAIKIFDPACGSGNFLTESYLSLRRLENEVLKKILGTQIRLGELDNPIKVSIANFYGIEINDFAVAVAQTALWIAELQMMTETQEIIHRDLDFLPIKSHANIHKANALRVDWKELVPEVDYIIGNPPFVGKSFQTAAQKSDMKNVFAGIKGYGNLDYVACWYKKAADFIQGTKISCAFVSTKSISQGIAVAPLWTYLFDKGIKINFVHQSFKWTSESSEVAAVYCVVVGFATFDAPAKKIYNGKECRVVEFINAYLFDGPDVIIHAQPKTPESALPMFVGSVLVDNGNFLFTEMELVDFLKREPAAAKWIRPFVGSREFIQGKRRFCLYLKNCPPGELRKMPLVLERVKNVREFRLASKKAATRRRAETPTLFTEDTFIDAPKIIFPRVSAATRKYVPLGFISAEVIVSDSANFIPNANLFHFGVLTSSIHMIWMKTVSGYLGTSYNYSTTIVYNTFSWCTPTSAQRVKIETTAQNILDVRARYPDSTLADLYAPLTMPRDLREAHQANDRAVAKAYGFENILDDESAIVAKLMELYAALIKNVEVQSVV